jgi:cytochrome d ubiquinol oxidase subunit II
MGKHTDPVYLGSVLFLLLFLVHGSIWLSIKSKGDLQARASSTAHKLWPVLVGFAVIFLIASAVFTKLYENFLAYPALFIIILLAVAALLSVINRGTGT